MMHESRNGSPIGPFSENRGVQDLQLEVTGTFPVTCARKSPLRSTCKSVEQWPCRAARTRPLDRRASEHNGSPAMLYPPKRQPMDIFWHDTMIVIPTYLIVVVSILLLGMFGTVVVLLTKWLARARPPS